MGKNDKDIEKGHHKGKGLDENDKKQMKAMQEFGGRQ